MGGGGGRSTTPDEDPINPAQRQRQRQSNPQQTRLGLGVTSKVLKPFVDPLPQPSQPSQPFKVFSRPPSSTEIVPPPPPSSHVTNVPTTTTTATRNVFKPFVDTKLQTGFIPRRSISGGRERSSQLQTFAPPTPSPVSEDELHQPFHHQQQQGSSQGQSEEEYYDESSTTDQSSDIDYNQHGHHEGIVDGLVVDEEEEEEYSLYEDDEEVATLEGLPAPSHAIGTSEEYLDQEYGEEEREGGQGQGTYDVPLGGRLGRFNVMTPITERTYEFTSTSMRGGGFTPGDGDGTSHTFRRYGGGVDRERFLFPTL